MPDTTEKERQSTYLSVHGAIFNTVQLIYRCIFSQVDPPIGNWLYTNWVGQDTWETPKQKENQWKTSPVETRIFGRDRVVDLGQHHKRNTREDQMAAGDSKKDQQQSVFDDKSARRELMVGGDLSWHSIQGIFQLQGSW